MVYPNGGIPVWFGKGRDLDAAYLQAWREAPLTYAPDDATDSNWNADRYEIVLGQDATGKLFQRASDLVMHNRFYPSQVMKIVSDYSLEGRPVHTGDRVLQRVLVCHYEGLPLLEVLTLNEITEVIDEPRRAGFTYTTTTAHSEIGEWSPRVEWRENGEVALVIEVVSRSRPGMSAFSRRLSRRMQLRAHKLSIQNFIAQLSGEVFRMPEQSAIAVPRLAPLGLALLALLFLFGSRWSTSHTRK